MMKTGPPLWVFLWNIRFLVLAFLLSCMHIRPLDALYPVSVVLKDGMRFDYIVVGAGAAGAAAAARLALAGNQVLLVEAGGNPNLLSKIPTAAMGLLGSSLDWQYKTISNNVSCLSSVDQQCRFSRGKCLGGSTSINYMLYTRGNRKQDFKEIECPGWTFDDLMPYFLRYEGLQDLDKLPPSSIPYHNTTGIMRIGFFDDPQNPWNERLINSLMSLQIPLNPDINSASQIGVTTAVGYVYRGQRMSTARAYLTRKDVKKVLKVAKRTMCTGVIVNNQNVARGVTVVQSYVNKRIYARKEVILSAGAIGTPQILMLSGIGPAQHLRSIGIPVKADLPVGDRMTDHILPLIVIQVDRGIGVIPALESLVATITQLTELLVQWRGPLSSIGITETTTLLNSHCYDLQRRQLLNVSSDGSDCEVPNLQIIKAYIERYLIPSVKPIFKNSIGFNDEVIDQLSDANKNYAFIVMSPILLEPRSEGNVRLASRDPLARPAIFPNYIGDDRDLDDLVRFICIIEQIVETSPFRQQDASLLHLNLTGCPSYSEDSEEYWRCYVRHMTFAVYHAAGTAAIGCVLDERLRVHGVKRLRVADLSVLPRAPRCSTTAVTIAIGERVADFVLEDNKI